MTLPKNVYTAPEDIVGKENISDDPAVLDSYRYSLAHPAIHLSLGWKEVGVSAWRSGTPRHEDPMARRLLNSCSD